MVEIVYTEKFKELSLSLSGATDLQPKGIAEELVKKGYAVYKNKREEVAPIANEEVVVDGQKKRGNPNFGNKK